MTRRSRSFISLSVTVGVVLLAYSLIAHAQGRLVPPAAGEPVPAFTHTAAAEWLNSPPLTLESLRGKVVLLDFWTFACWKLLPLFPLAQ